MRVVQMKFDAELYNITGIFFDMYVGGEGKAYIEC